MFFNRKYPETISIEELIETNSFVKTEYEKYIKLCRIIANKYIHEYIKLDPEDICIDMISPYIENMLYSFIKNDCLNDDEEHIINPRAFYMDRYDINKHLYDDPYSHYIIDYQTYADKDEDCRTRLNDAINHCYDCFNNYDYVRNKFSREHEDIVKDLYKTLEDIRVNKFVDISNMSIKEIYEMNSLTLNEFLTRFIIYFDDNLSELLESHYSEIHEVFVEIKLQINETLNNGNDEITISLNNFNSINETYKFDYTRLIETIVDNAMKDIYVTCTIHHFAKWFVDSDIWTNDI